LRRRVDTEISLNHERWLVSYADFVTLLFALFVVLYSISQVNESKYKDLSEAMNKVFNESSLSIKPIQVGEVARAINDDTTAVTELSNSTIETYPLNTHDPSTLAAAAELPQLADQFSDAFSSLIDEEIIQINNNEFWLEVSLSNSILFTLGSVNVNESAQKYLSEIADILRPFNNPVQVEGYTDNLTVNSTQFPSNWELSSARAAAIVKILVDGGVIPARLSAVGYGEYRPTSGNDTPEGREKNRRVVLMIAREKQDRPKAQSSPVIIDALNPRPVEPTQVMPQPNLERANTKNSNVDLESPKQITKSEGSVDANNIPIDNGSITPVETQSGGLLFSSEPDR
jgi:chemotaxis protein MotB